jgi:phage terminase large subunit-like protein
VPLDLWTPWSELCVVEYRPATCGYCGDDTWCETRANGQPQCRACKVERFFANVLYPPLGYRLMAWQRKVLRGIYGNPDPITGLRRYRSAYISVGKKNGKSFLIGGLPIYHLLMENERNPEAYGAAAAKDQATIVFRAAAQLVEANPDLRSRLRVLPSTKRIVRRDGGGFYAVLSADGDVQDGVEPSLLLRDEIHRWKSARAETLKDVLTKGQISREEPLDIAVTTAGAEYESQLWWQEYQHAKKVLDGSLPTNSLFVAIWEADRKRIESEPEYWKSREARVAANPSHEDNEGGFLKDTALVGEMNKAIDEPSQRSKYLRYHLNVPISQQEEPVIEMEKWQTNGGGVDLRDWPTYDVELLISKWGLADRPCWCGVDASWTTDLTAVVFVFPPFEGVDEWTLLPFAWMPEERVEKLERICRVPYRHWIDSGFLSATPGNGIDMRAVTERIRWGREMFDLAEVDYDRINFRTEAMELRDDGIETIEVSQNFLLLSHPTKFLLSSYMDAKLRHGNHPVLNWMASCMQLQYDRKDNCQPTKPERMKSAKRIDGIAATVTALSRMLVAENNTISYTGLRSVG